MQAMRTTMLVVLAVMATAAVAQETFDEKVEAGSWGSELTLGLNMLQSYYTDNWNGGDLGSVSWAGNLDARAVKQVSTSWRWHNTLNLAFGQNHQQRREDGELQWNKPDKTTDRFDAETLIRNNTSKWGPFAGLRFQSVFLDQTDPRGDFTLNPLRFFATLGISRAFVDTEEKKFFLRLGATGQLMDREMFLDETYGDDPVKESASDVGLELVLNFIDTKLTTNIEYDSQLRFYQPFYYSAKGAIEDLGSDYLESIGLPGDLADYFTTLDIDWQNTFKANITSVINVQLHLRWVYDKYDNTAAPVVVSDEIHNVATVNGSIRKTGQFKQTMSLGVGYTF